MVILASVQVADLFISNRASQLPPGSTSGYFKAFQLMQLPETLLGTAIAIVVFPTMAELYNAGDLEGLKRTAMSALRIIWTLTIPAAVGLVALGRPAIALFLEGGAFDEASTRLVYSVLTVFGVRVVSEATLEIVARLFYARHNTRTPMIVALGWLATNALLAFLLAGSLGVRGLALASTVAFTAQAAALFVLNRRELGNLGELELFMSAGRSLLGAAIMAALILALSRVISHEPLYLVVGGVLGLVAYFSVTLLLGGRELSALLRLVRRRQLASPPHSPVP